MSIGTAISMTSPDTGRIIAAASLRAQERGWSVTEKLVRLAPPFDIVVVQRA